MTKQEFNRWLKDYSAAFPDTASWLNNSADRTATLEFWYAALEPVDFQDAKQATRRLAVGDEPDIPAYERQTIPRVVAAIAKRIRGGRRIVPREEALPDYGGGKWSLAGTLNATRGKSMKEAMKLIAEMIPADSSPRSYRCLKCRDTGTVLVWANRTIHAVMHGAEHIPLYRCSLRCDCQANRRWSETFPVYEEGKYCLFSGYDAIHEVEQWCEVYKQIRLQSMPNYEPSFDEWNNS